VLLGLLVGGGGWAQAASVPEGRGVEMVSPLDKNGGEVSGNGESVIAALDGNAVAYSSRASFGDTIGSGPVGQTMYLARRGSDGWQSHAITPTPAYDAPVSSGVPLVVDFARDLQNALAWAFALPAVPASHTANIYSERTDTDGLSLVTANLAGPQTVANMASDFGANGVNLVGVSDDGHHVAFNGRATQLLPAAPAGVPSVYEWDNGALRLVSILPDGSVAAAGAVLPNPNSDPSQAYRQTVSPDGSRVLFLSPAPVSGAPPVDAQLYERVDHARTVWVSQPEVSGSPPAPENIVLQEVTGDSRHIIFTTTSQLLPDDANSGSDIYLYTDTPNPASDANLTLVTSSGDVDPFLSDGGTAVVGSSDDGSRIYYDRANEIFVWHDGVSRGVLGNLLPYGDQGLAASATVSEPGGARVTPDGRYMAMIARGTPGSGGPNPVIGDGGGLRELYLYDAVTDQVRCVSCPTSGPATANSDVIPAVSDNFPQQHLAGLRPSYLASDGRVFFSTTQALVPQDVNGVSDVYEFDPATESVSLVSTGTGADGAAFVDASQNGSDVFMVTRQRLVAADQDDYIDLYDARVGGGFPDAPNPPAACVGDACQGAVTPPPPDVSPGSLGLAGDASPLPPPPAGRLRFISARVHGSAAVVRVASPAAGSLSWAGTDVRRGSRRLSKAATYQISIGLTPSARRALLRRGSVRVRLRLVLAPAAGARTTTSISLTFKSSPKKGR
jgi:hypothetical protein